MLHCIVIGRAYGKLVLQKNLKPDISCLFMPYSILSVTLSVYIFPYPRLFHRRHCLWAAYLCCSQPGAPVCTLIHIPRFSMPCIIIPPYRNIHFIYYTSPSFPSKKSLTYAGIAYGQPAILLTARRACLRRALHIPHCTSSWLLASFKQLSKIAP